MKLKFAITTIIISVVFSLGGLYNNPAFAQDSSPIELISEQCSGSFDGFGYDITMTVTIKAKRALEYVSVQGSVGGEDVLGAYDVSGALSAGQQKTFRLTGYLFSLPNDRQCAYYFEWLEIVTGPDPDPDPDPDTDGNCRVGDVLSPGESCNIPGTTAVFTVLADGRGNYRDGGININVGGGGISLGGFGAQKQGDGTWRITSLPSNQPDPEPEPEVMTEPKVLVVDPDSPPIYWTDWGTDKIQRANLDGSTVEDLVTRGLNAPGGIALDVADGKMYWTDWETEKIQRANLDGSNVEELVTRGLGDPKGIALDVAGGKMYWTDDGTRKIQRANLDGSTVEDLVTRGLVRPQGIALDVAGGKMYWTDWETEKIQRADLNGSNVEDLVTRGLKEPGDIALDVAGGKMYWTDVVTEKIQRANLDGSTVEDLVTTGLDLPVGIALDVAGGKIYWTDVGTDKIQRANLDGSNVEDVVTGLDGPQFIALDIPSQSEPGYVTVKGEAGQIVISEIMFESKVGFKLATTVD